MKHCLLLIVTGLTLVAGSASASTSDRQSDLCHRHRRWVPAHYVWHHGHRHYVPGHYVYWR